MEKYFVDLHVHIGRSEENKPIKITAARSLNFANIASECVSRKGINIVGIVDCGSPYVQQDIENFLQNGEAYEIPEGGIIYKDSLCIILGSEIETVEQREDGKLGSAHNVCFFPTLKDIKAFTEEMRSYIKNVTLSSQRSTLSAKQLLHIVESHNGFLMPAHCFTPHKSFYGNCTDRLKKIFTDEYDKIFCVELGLSSDTFLADKISELDTKTFVTNSDAHSLPKIAREYNVLQMDHISFAELVKALKREDGRCVVSNYGLDPKLGKYHRTFCETCEKNVDMPAPALTCPDCDSKNITTGVFDRIEVIKDNQESKSPDIRPPYIYQIPLQFIPGIGGKTISKLIDYFGTEMNILHKATFDDIESVVGPKYAKLIIDAREGNLKVIEGGGGIYGKIAGC